MSALTHYIHYTAKGYEEHGITQKGANTAYDYLRVKQNILNKINSNRVNSEQTNQEIADALNLFYNKSKDSAIYDKDIQIMQKEIENKLFEKYGQTLGDIDWMNLDIKKQEVNTSKSSVIKKIKSYQSTDKVMLSTILKKVHILEEVAETLTKSKDKTLLLKEITQLYVAINQLVTGAKRGRITEFRSTSADDLGKLSQNNKISMKSAEGVIAQINALLKQYSSVPAINLQKGDLFEYLISLAPFIAGQKGKKAVQDYFTQVIGGDRSKVNIVFNDKIEDVSGLNFSNYYKDSASQVFTSYGASQDKIDINLLWNESIVPISAKNINLSNTKLISVSKGNALDTYLSGEDDNFRYHYYNTIVEHGSFKNGTPQNNSVALQGYELAHDAMKWISFFKGITGAVGDRESAEVFIVNDNSNQKEIRVFQISDLIAKALEDIDKYTKIKANGQNLSELRIKNNYAETAQKRFEQVLTSIHAQKLYVALKTNLLEEA